METSKSTLTVAQEALKAGQESLPDYRHPKSPKKFTQPQLFACLVVKEFRRLDYRGIWVLLQEGGSGVTSRISNYSLLPRSRRCNVWSLFKRRSVRRQACETAAYPT
ncbi:MAG: hypothetical protein M1376_04090, partial [Planctomycetes bacterium]|nr:hypothetical protein [Planctomycetota bacterium]